MPLTYVTLPSLGSTAIILIMASAGLFLVLALGREASDPPPSPAADMKRDAELKSRLTSEQYYVTQQSGTEWPFLNAYWNNERDGIYVDVVTGQPLFSSSDKFNSGTGWPSFTKPIDAAAVVQRSDGSAGMDRMEVRSAQGNSHLGHVFDDGPAPTGERYCINSAALRFVPKEKLKEEGYSQYLPLFQATESK